MCNLAALLALELIEIYYLRISLVWCLQSLNVLLTSIWLVVRDRVKVFQMPVIVVKLRVSSLHNT